MSLDTIRARIYPLTQIQEPTTIERKRIEKFERLVRIDAELQKYAQELVEDRARWEEQKAKCNTAAKLKKLRKWPTEPKYVLELQQVRHDLMMELGEIPPAFVPRTRPVLSPVEYPAGPKCQFTAYHTWLELPPVPAGTSHRGKGPGENEINALTGAAPPNGGRFDHALPGGESAETKATSDNTFRGGATSRRNINRVRRRVERIIDQIPDLILLAEPHLSADDFVKMEHACRLLDEVNASLEYGNLHDADLQGFYTALEILNHIDWNDAPTLYREDEFIRHPQGVHLFCRYLGDMMMGGKCFFTDYIFIVKPVEKPTHYLVIPKSDYDKTVHFLHLSKSDAHFKYFQPSVVPITQDLANVASQ